MTESPKSRDGHAGKLEAWELEENAEPEGSEGMDELEGAEEPEGVVELEGSEGLGGVEELEGDERTGASGGTGTCTRYWNRLGASGASGVRGNRPECAGIVRNG